MGEVMVGLAGVGRKMDVIVKQLLWGREGGQMDKFIFYGQVGEKKK